jgi:hypothetical protein
VSARADDRARVSMLVRVPPAVAFCAFTEDVDQWLRRGRKYRSPRSRSPLSEILSRRGPEARQN